MFTYDPNSYTYGAFGGFGNTSYPTNFGIRSNSNVTESGGKPILVAVESGSYAQTGSFGSGAVSLSTAQASQDLNTSSFTIRRQDKLVDFDLKLVIKLTGANPLAANPTGELRINTISEVSGASTYRQTHARQLPPVAHGSMPPLFNDVEILQESGLALTSPAFPASTAGIGQIKARYIHGGELALVTVNHTVANNAAGHVVPLLASDLTPYFNTSNRIVISVRGHYLSE